MKLTTPQKKLISDDQSCHDTPLILTGPSNCSTILLRIIVCLDNGETAHLSLVACRMANIIDNIQQGVHGTAQSSATCKDKQSYTDAGMR